MAKNLKKDPPKKRSKFHLVHPAGSLQGPAGYISIDENLAMNISRIMPPTYMLIAMIVMIVINFLAPVAVVVPSPWNLLGLIPIGVGVYIAVAAERAFHDVKTTVTPFVESSSLVTDGMYRISRNPMYLGFVLVLIGIAILMRSLTPYGVILAFMAVIKTIFIRTEERMLAAKFGAKYKTYTKNTRRWL